ncbi:hypothetical protein ACU4GR_10770 [Methylobacterium oryzae CBMB20]
MAAHSKAEPPSLEEKMIVLVLAGFLSSIIAVVCTWHWLMYSALIAPLGAGAGTVLMGLILAWIETFHKRRMRAAAGQAEDRRAAMKESDPIKRGQA